MTKTMLKVNAMLQERMNRTANHLYRLQVDETGHKNHLTINNSIMRTLFLSIALCLLSMTGNAQTDVTKFLGIPVDGSKSEMVGKLKAKGFKLSPIMDDMLTGQFNGGDVQVFIATNNEKVCRIMVSDANAVDEGNIKIRFNRLYDQFKDNPKYMEYSDSARIDDSEDISYEMSIHNKRYQAVFCQLPDISSTDYEDGLEALIFSKYTKEQLQDPTEEISKDLQAMSFQYYMEKAVKKPVWFMIFRELWQILHLFVL